MLLLQRGFDLSLFGSRPTRLIRPGWKSDRLDFARAQAGGAVSASLGADDATWSEVAADVPRYYGSARRLRVEGQRTNGNRNPRFDSASVGTPGSPGTNLTLSQPGSGIAASVAGVGTDSGAAYIDVRVYGTASSAVATTAGLLSFDTTTAISAANGQVWSAAFTARIVAGAFAGTLTQDISERAAGGGAVRQNNTALSAPESTDARLSSSATLVGGVTTAGVQQVLRWGCGSGAVVDFTLRIKLPQIEQASFASTPILPASGTPAASTRGADLLSAPLARLGIRDSGACTVLGTFMIPQAAPSGVSQILFCVDDGTAANRLLIRNAASTTALVPVRTLANSTAQGSSAGSFTPGSAFAVGAAMAGDGSIRMSLAGGSIQSVSGGPTSGLTTIRGGVDASGASNLFGDVGYLDILPYAVSDAQPQALVAAMPLS